MSAKDLLDFYDIVEDFATFSLTEKSFLEQLINIKLVNEQTGQELFYSPEVGDWRPRDGEEMQVGDELELNKNNPQKGKFTIIGSYRIENVES